MHFVRAKTDGVWDTAVDPQGGTVLYPKPPRHLVRCLVEDGVWAVDKEAVEVERGLVVGYTREEDAEYMLKGHHPRKELPRGEPVYVQPGMIVAFHAERDAQWAVATGKADAMTPEEVMQAMAEAQAAFEAQQQAGEDEMHKPKLENKAGAGAAETKTTAPKLAPAKGKKGGK